VADKGIDTDTARKRLILENPEYDKLELTLLQDTVLFSPRAKKKITCTCKKGDRVKLVSNKISDCGRSKYCGNVNVDGKNGWVQLNHIVKPDAKNTDVMSAEKAAMTQLDKLLKEMLKCRGPATLCTPVGEFRNACGVKTIKGTPKADFAIVDQKGKEIMWISHKKTGGAKAFQQYGGLSKTAGAKIANHEETRTFLQQTAAYVTDNKLQVPTMKPVKDDNLIRMAVFGPDSGGKYGKNNCHVLGQGNALLKEDKKRENCWDLKWEHTVWNDSNGVNAFKRNDGYQATFGATYRGDRGFTVLDKSYKGARVGIYPKALMSGRTNVTLLEDA